MRRQDIQLLAAARQGSAAACCEIGRRYLLGSNGFPRHVQTGLDYLSRPAVRESPCAIQAIADGLPLHEALELGQLDILKQAARTGHPAALCKLGGWHLTRPSGLDEALRCLQLAAAAGSAPARLVLQLRREDATPIAAAAQLTERLGESGAIDAPAVLSRALLRARAAQDLDGLHWCLGMVARWQRMRCSMAAELVVDAVDLAERSARELDDLPFEFVAEALEQRSLQADTRSQFALGRLLCGIPCGALQPRWVARSLNLRKGAALLLRAADAGEVRAWVHLHCLSSDHRCSVANPQMARFFLEKAAAQGDAESQRRLGALLLREASSIDDTERALGWLHRAARHGDLHAVHLMQSLVLPVHGGDAEALDAMVIIARTSPWLAARMDVSRHFGLTRLEALTMDPAQGMRSWGLVVGPNRFVRKARLAAPRAVPALGEPAVQALQTAARLFATPDRDEGPQHRTRLLRSICAKHGIDESIFFAAATADTLASLRSGTRWAHKQRDALRSALLMPA
ncbi:MAG: hypothetical protein AB7O64_00290 [Methylibium sp.]